MSDTLPVSVTVTTLERVGNLGRIKAFASIELSLDGVEIRLHGVRVVEYIDRLSIEVPQWRHCERWLPAVGLPEELREVIGALVIEKYRQGDGRPAPIITSPNVSYTESRM